MLVSWLLRYLMFFVCDSSNNFGKLAHSAPLPALRQAVRGISVCDVIEFGLLFQITLINKLFSMTMYFIDEDRSWSITRFLFNKLASYGQLQNQLPQLLNPGQLNFAISPAATTGLLRDRSGPQIQVFGNQLPRTHASPPSVFSSRLCESASARMSRSW